METQGKVTATRHYLVLDSLRGVCACLVALFHFGTHGVVTNLPLVTHGYLFVDFFFVLSGFVIAASYRDRLAAGFSPARFLGLRLGRIYPLHLFMLAVFVGFDLFSATVLPNAPDRHPFTANHAPTDIVWSLLLMQIFVGAPAQWNAPSWSIAAEFWTYCVFALVFRWGTRVLVPVCLLLAVGGLAILSVATDFYIGVFHDWALVRCIAGFALGVVAERVLPRLPSVGGREGTVVELVLIAGLVAFVSTASGIRTLAAPPLFMVVVLVFARQAGLVSRMLSVRPLLWVGSLSYSIYMVHNFIQVHMVNALARIGRAMHMPGVVDHVGPVTIVGGSAIFSDVAAIVMLTMVIAASALTYRFIELPGQRWSRRSLIAKKASTATLPAL